MNPTARISLLLGALILLVFGIVCLKQQLGPGQTPPAFVSPGTDASAADPRGFSGHQPTILSAEPSGEHDMNASPRLREVSPVPLDEPHATPFEFPVNTTQPDIPREVLPSASYGDGNTPHRPDFSGTNFSDDLLAPQELKSPVAGSPIPAMAPTSVVTAAGDSLWTISERVYGVGEYYKALYLHNRALLPRPDRIAAGIELKTPSLEELHRLFPDACPPPANRPAPPRGG